MVNQNLFMTYFASNAKAIIPVAIGHVADVPWNEFAHPPLVFVVD